MLHPSDKCRPDLPFGLRHLAALATTFQGPGRSRKTASVRPSWRSSGKPFSMMSRYGRVTIKRGKGDRQVW